MSDIREKDAAAPRKINQADIARRAEVSISTVSRALSGAPGTRPEGPWKTSECYNVP